MLTWDQAFFFRGMGKKEMPDTFTSRVVCHPLIKSISQHVCYFTRFYRKFKRFVTKAAIIKPCKFIVTKEDIPNSQINSHK